MKIDTRIQNLDQAAIVRAFVFRSARFGLARFGAAISQVTVRVSDVNGPKGGADKLCRVTLAGPVLGTLNVEQLSEDAYSAIHLAFERAARAARRELDRAREVRGT